MHKKQLGHSVHRIVPEARGGAYGESRVGGDGVGRVTHSFNRMTSASTLNIWYSPEASFTRRMMELVSCVMGCSMDGQSMPWCRCSRSRWTARTEMARGRKGQDFILAHWREVQAWETMAVRAVCKRPDDKGSFFIVAYNQGPCSVPSPGYYTKYGWRWIWV